MPPRQRTPVGTQISSGGFRPASAPVDAFERPNEGANLAQLADALGQLSPSLRRLAQTTNTLSIATNQKEAEEAFLAEQEAMREANLTFQEAQDAGIIQNHQNPVRRARQAELHGRAAAEREATAWLAYRNSNLPPGSTLEDYDEAFNAFHEEYTASNVGASAMDEPAFATAYRQTNQVRLLNDRRAFASQASVGYDLEADNEFYAEVFQSTLNDIQSGVATQDVGASLQARLDAHLGMTNAKGARRAQLNGLARTALIDATVRAAATTDIPGAAEEYLTALEAVVTAPGQNLGSSVSASQEIERARDQIQQNEAARDRRYADGNSIRGIELKTGMAQAAVSGDIAAIEEMAAEYAGLTGDIQFVSSIRTAAEKSLDIRTRSIPGLVNSYRSDIWSGGDPTDLRRRLVMDLNLDRLNGDDAQMLENLIVSASNASGAGALSNRIFTANRSNFINLIRGNEYDFNEEKGAKLIRFEPFVNELWANWVEANPGSSPQQQRDAAQQILEEGLRLVSPQLAAESLDVVGMATTMDPSVGWRTRRVASEAQLELLERDAEELSAMTPEQQNEYRTLSARFGLSASNTSLRALFISRQRMLRGSTPDAR